MAKNKFLNSIKNKLIFVLMLTCLLCFSVFGLMACSEEEDETSSNPTYTYSQTDNGDIKNANFSYGVVGKDNDDYPLTSTTGWTRATHNSAASSTVNSGTIKVTPTAWDALMVKLLDDNDFSTYLTDKGLYDLEDVKTAIKNLPEHADDSGYTPTEDDIYNYIAETYLQTYNPGTHAGATDSNVYMLNNILESKLLGTGTAQRLTSSSSITLEKGKVGKISVWIKTLNLTSQNVDGDFGANIVLTNMFNGTQQPEFRVSNIRNTEWEQYTIYVQADKNYDCAITLALGLGYGSGNSLNALYHTEGTVFFDDITFETLDAIPNGVIIDQTTVMTYAGENPTEVKTGKVFLYDMQLDFNAYFTAHSFSNSSANYYYTKSNVNNLTSQNIVGNDSQVNYNANGSKLSLTLNKASYTVKIDDDGSNFVVDNGKYTYITFKIKNNLSKFGSTDITVDLFDINGSTVKKRAAVATFSEVSDEWIVGKVLVKNNFTAGSREFYLEIVVGPTDILAVNYNSLFATGTVEIDSLAVRTAEMPVADDEGYNLYAFYESVANANVALYAGYGSDYQDSEESVNVYDFTSSPSSIGEIVNQPTNVNGYYGVTSDHAYVNGGETLAVDTRSELNGDANGNYAGLISTKYLNNYTIGTAVSNALNHNPDDDDKQVVMIYNNVADSYGYIGSSETFTQSCYANIVVKLRVVDLAKAYVYLVTTSGAEKTVMTFDDFTVNTGVVNNISNGAEIKGSEYNLAFEVTSSMMDENGWLTLNFFVANGEKTKDFRVEVWNGSRDGANKSQGFVFVERIQVITGAGFSEPTSYSSAFSISGNPLYDAYVKDANAFTQANSLIAYVRELTSTEKAFNDEYPDKAVSYKPTYVWAKTNDMIYAVYNTIDPVEIDPYEGITEDTEEGAGCTAIEEDPSAFWLGFSSILLGVVLLLAIIALVIKTYRRKKKANASDAKSHYKVTSRISNKKHATTEKTEKVEEQFDDFDEEEIEVEETIDEEVNDEEQTLNEYVYGDVQDFGEEQTVLEEDDQKTETADSTEEE